MKVVWFTGSFSIALLGGVFLLHGSQEHFLLSTASAAVCAVSLFFAWRTKKDGKASVSHAAMGVALFLCGLGLSYFPGALFYRAQISATKRLLSPVFLSLEEGRRVNGAYPERIDGLLDQNQLPWLTRGSVTLSSRADHFWVYFRDPNSGLMDIFIYDSDAKAWAYRQR